MPNTLSILIPSRNEMFLARTVKDLLENIEGTTEILIGLDGQWAEPAIPDDPRVTLLYYPQSIGQRAMTNQLARISKAKYVMKVDAHCAFDKGFDVKLMADMRDNWTMVPVMRNLHAFDWVCEDGHRRYQGPSGPCKECQKPTERDVMWIAKSSPQSTSYCFDSEPHFQYFGEWKRQQKGDLVETMSLQGSCFMMTLKKYWELDICDEKTFGSWGSQGIEVAVKTWLSGGKVICNKNTWYAHMFRTQGGDFSFPYPQQQSKVVVAKKMAKDLFFNNKWPKAKMPLSWLVERFWPVPGWSDEAFEAAKERGRKFYVDEGTSKGIIYFTDNQLGLKISHAVQKQLKTIGLPIVSASLKPMNFGKNVHLKLARGYLTMFKQILAALEASESDVIFFCEHDVLYPKAHFDFTPERRDTFYYDINVWKVRLPDGLALWVNNCRQVSGLCGYRDELIKHYRERVALVEKEGYHRNMGFEPVTHGRIKWQNEYKTENWMAEVPMLDIRHEKNLTPNRWSIELFRDKRNAEGWKEAYDIPGWGKTDALVKNLNRT